jgi:hypothetical protein
MTRQAHITIAFGETHFVETSSKGGDWNEHCPAGELVYPSVWGMKSMRVLLCVVVMASVATVSVVRPLQAAEISTSTTIVASPSVSSQPFTWSKRTLTVGATLKASKLVSSKIKGTRTYRATGVCSLRKGVLSFKRAGKCRVTVSVTSTSTKKVTRSSKLFTVKSKQFSVPQMQLTGTPEEQLSQVVAATAKVAAISDSKGLSSRESNDSFGRLNDSLVSYGIKVTWDPNNEGLDIYQITMGGQSTCFLWSYGYSASDSRSLQPHTCSDS